MGIMKSAFNAACRLHSRPVIHKRLTASPNPTLFSPARATPSNYFRYLAGPSETVVTGSEFILPVSSLTGTQIQLISFNQVPTVGTWRVVYGTSATTYLNFDATASDLQVALRLITGLELVVVTGDYTLGFSVEMFGIQSPLTFAVQGSAGGTPQVLIGAFTTPHVYDSNLQNFTVDEGAPGSAVYTIDPTDLKVTIPATASVANGDHFIFADDSNNYYYLIIELDGVQLPITGGWVSGPNASAFWIYIPVVTGGTSLQNTQALQDALTADTNFTANLTSSFSGNAFDATGTVAVQDVGTLFSPLILRGDKLLDGSKSYTIKEIIEMPDVGGDVLGYRVRVE